MQVLQVNTRLDWLLRDLIWMCSARSAQVVQASAAAGKGTEDAEEEEQEEQDQQEAHLMAKSLDSLPQTNSSALPKLLFRQARAV